MPKVVRDGEMRRAATTVRSPLWLHAEVEERSQAMGLTRSEFYRLAAEFYLEHLLTRKREEAVREQVKRERGK